MSESFVLGEAAKKTGKKSLSGLKAHVQTEKGQAHHVPIFIVINSKIPYLKEKDYIPRIIPISKKLDRLEDKSVLLITKDPSTPYRAALTEKDSPTEDVFNQIYTLTKVKSIARNPKQNMKMFKEFDLVVADHRVHKFLPNVLGATFYEKNKKVPFMLQMARPSPDAKLVQGKKSTKLKDDRCEPKYVRTQMKSITGNAHYNPPARGTCVTIKVGYSDWEVADLVTNINDVVKYLTDSSFLPVGGLLRTTDNIVSVHVKTGDSASLPVLVPVKQSENSDDENYSDFDF